MTMQAWAWEYVDSNGIAWRILGHTARRKKVYCIRGDEFAGAFDPDQPSLVEDGISRWPEVVRAKWREVIEAARKAVR